MCLCMFLWLSVYLCLCQPGFHYPLYGKTAGREESEVTPPSRGGVVSSKQSSDSSSSSAMELLQQQSHQYHGKSPAVRHTSDVCFQHTKTMNKRRLKTNNFQETKAHRYKCNCFSYWSQKIGAMKKSIHFNTIGLLFEQYQMDIRGTAATKMPAFLSSRCYLVFTTHCCLFHCH